jgi:hypothetical protein
MESETRIEQKRRLLSKGKWGKFSARLQELKDEGFTEEGGWSKAYEEMRVGQEGEDVSTDRAGGSPARKKRAVKTEVMVAMAEAAKVEVAAAKRKAAGAQEVIEWVAEHLNDKKDTQYKDFPSTAAVNMLITLREDERGKSKFYLDVYMRQLLMNGEREHEERRRMGDDGRVLTLLDEFEKIAEEAME